MDPTVIATADAIATGRHFGEGRRPSGKRRRRKDPIRPTAGNHVHEFNANEIGARQRTGVYLEAVNRVSVEHGVEAPYDSDREQDPTDRISRLFRRNWRTDGGKQDEGDEDRVAGTVPH